jgi:hypothetical protein
VPDPAKLSVTVVSSADSSNKASAAVTITARTQVQLVSANLHPAGTQPENTLDGISSDGRFVLFDDVSLNPNVMGPNPGVPKYFLSLLGDTCIGASQPCRPSAYIVAFGSTSDDTFGNLVGNTVAGWAISGSGRYAGTIKEVLNGNQPTGEADLWDTCTGMCTNLIDSQAGIFSAASLSASGRFVSIGTDSTLYVRDSCLGATGNCTPGDAWTAQYGANTLFGGVIAAEGRYVAFASTDSTIVPNDTNGVEDVFLADTCIGAAAGCVPQVTRVSVTTAGIQGNGASFSPSITPDGRFIAFTSSASNLVPGDTNGADDVFVHDTCNGAPPGCVPSTYRVSLASDGSEGNGGSATSYAITAPTLISADGRYVTFFSAATNLVPGDSNGFPDVFVRDTCQGASQCSPSTIRVSLAQNDGQGNNASYGPMISADGQYVAYNSYATNIVSNSDGASINVFLVKVQWP